MFGRRSIFFGLGGLLILALIVNIYFLRLIVENSSQEFYVRNTPLSQLRISKEELALPQIKDHSLISTKSKNADVRTEIKKEIERLPSKYFKRNENYLILLKRLLAELEVKPITEGNIWNIPKNKWIAADRLIPPNAPELGSVLNAFRKLKILRADNAVLGTQLKLMLYLEHGVKAMFKPQWYPRNALIQGPVYYGKDRHNAEVVAFHLSSLLDFRRVPLTVIRKLDLKNEISVRATPSLYATMYQDGNNTCLYGVCHYCSPDDPVCGSGNNLEGALILWLPKYIKLRKYRHPWQRTYKKNKLAPWEIDGNYCEKVKGLTTYSPQTSNRLLDLVDTAIFDFLMDNGDRHHYELAQTNFHDPTVLLIDNGKSLGNPHVDHLDILAPLYQCCTIYKTTWHRLTMFSGGVLSTALGKLLLQESRMAGVLHLLTDAHLKAMDRRLLTVYAVVEYCLKHKKDNATVFADPV